MLDARRAALKDVMNEAGNAPEAPLASAAGLPSLLAKQTMTEEFARLVGAWDAV